MGAMLILLAAAYLVDGFLLGTGLKHLREVTGPWSSDVHEYDA